MRVYSHDEVKDMLFGPVGTPERDEYENQLREELQSYYVGEAIRQARKSKSLTQAELGERIGVQKSQISRIESGKSITLATLSRVLKAMDIHATLDMGSAGRVALW